MPSVPNLSNGRRSGPGVAVQALGRMKTGVMNKTEAAYADHLEFRRRAGEVAQVWFEGVTLKLAERCRYTPDFLVMLTDGRIEAHEVKGHWQDDARVKIKVAAEKFPFRFVAVRAVAKREGGGWAEEDFS